MSRHEAVLPVGSIALRYGVSVFEGIRCYLGSGGTVRPWLLEPHLDRLRNSCALMGFDPECCAAVPAAVGEVLRANQVAEDCYLRVAVSAGNEGGIDDVAEPVLTVSATPSGRKRWLATGEGIGLQVSRWQRQSAAAFPSAAKNISAYSGPRLALAEARAGGYHNCVLRTADGLISETPTATVFLVEDGRLVTPRLADAVLPGLTRAWVLATAPGMGLDAAAEAVTPQRLRAAAEVFLCGTGLEFGPVKEVDGEQRSAWPSCPVTTALVDEYFLQVRGRRPATDLRWSAQDAAVPGTGGPG